MIYDSDGYALEDENAPTDPSANTWVSWDTPQYGTTQTPPFNHLDRLADKLFGAVELQIDNITYDQRMTALKNQRTYQQVSNQSQLLPQELAAFVSRQSGNITTLLILGGIFFLGSVLLRR